MYLMLCFRYFCLLTPLLLLACASSTQSPLYLTILDDLNEPRGILLRDDGTVCVAEAGKLEEGQEIRTDASSTSAETGALTCTHEAKGQRSLIENLPYTTYRVTGVSVGPTDVAELDGELYLLMGEGQSELSRTLLHIGSADDQLSVLADFLAFETATTEPDYFDKILINSNPFAMIAAGDGRHFLVTDGATGEILSVSLEGVIEVFSLVSGHEVLTGLAWGPDSLLYVASFSQLPHAAGSGAIVQVESNGSSRNAIEGLTAPIDVAFDKIGRLYVLEFGEGVGEGHPYRSQVGRLLRFIEDNGRWTSPQILLEGLPYPIAIVIDSYDTLYVTVHGAFSDPGRGKVLRFDHLVELDLGKPPLQYVDP